MMAPAPTERLVEIVVTDNTCVIAGKPRPGIPTLRHRDGFVLEEPSAWLRYLALKRRRARGSVKEYGKILADFLQFLASRKRWSVGADFRMAFDVDDGLLILWRDLMEAKGLVEQRINQKLSTVFRWLVGCQDSGLVSGLVGGAPGTPWPVTAETTVARDGRGGSVVKRRSPLLLPIRRQPRRHTPTTDEIRRLHEGVAGQRHAVRNALLLAWAEETGLRRIEMLSIVLDDIPSWDVIEALQGTGEIWRLKVRNGKGGKLRKVPVSPHLLFMTREYIELERQDLIERYAGRRVGVPDAVFLSDRCAEMNPNSVSNLAAKLLADAGVKRASLHRLRAVFLTRVVERFMDRTDEFGLRVGEETALLKAAEYAGHGSIETLRPYLTALKKARLESQRPEVLEELEERKRHLQREIAVLEARRAADLRGQLHGAADQKRAGAASGGRGSQITRANSKLQKAAR
jgi:integrase